MNVATTNDHARVFGRLFAERAHDRTSGPGSTLEYTRRYRAFLEQFVVEHAIESVVDVGCGDAEFSRAVDWKGANYVGLDVVPAVIERNRLAHPRVTFETADARDLSSYAGRDLLLVKDVLQHWSRESVRAFLRQPALASFGHVLITNCDDGHVHADIADGDFRPLGAASPELDAFGGTTALEFGTKRVLHRGPRLTPRDVFERFECWLINLERRPDRLAHARSELARIGLGHARRLQAFDGHRLQLTSARPDWVKRGAVGCYLSHLALLKQAQARRMPCIIVEDDLVLAPDFEPALAAFFRVLPEDWDIVLLSGGEHQKAPVELGPHLARLVATWGTSLTMLRLHAIDHLLEEADGLDRPIDDFYIRHMSSLKFYAPARRLVTQALALGTNIGDTP